MVGALSPLPVDVVARTPLPAINALLRDSVGWPAYVQQITDVYQALPAQERARTTIVVSNYGEAGALDRYGPDHDLPTAYSGHHELHRQGPPPTDADVVVGVVADVRSGVKRYGSEGWGGRGEQGVPAAATGPGWRG
ncbi:hypothetical protein SAMN04489712_12018 [Thermomonospora echinospora]|uniref:Uncharacterized protein n=1 Tax=Thermomonospora echinospora TaxID=1992 RepID=A0A1H6DNH6_9ACTN|nr:hypothetical protein SAMN04489712_12018 [Thermomonospora echinospora]